MDVIKLYGDANYYVHFNTTHNIQLGYDYNNVNFIAYVNLVSQ